MGSMNRDVRKRLDITVKGTVISPVVLDSFGAQHFSKFCRLIKQKPDKPKPWGSRSAIHSLWTLILINLLLKTNYCARHLFADF